jgi:aspartyl-tRNA(Asn)/glutamyl-tRNA(Gln) amidotransferase subunit C
MSGISKDEVLHVANLARLEINDEVAETYAEQLGRIISFAETLGELDTENVEPNTHVFAQENVMREYVPVKGLSIDEVVKNVPDHLDGQIKVPTILE